MTHIGFTSDYRGAELNGARNTVHEIRTPRGLPSQGVAGAARGAGGPVDFDPRLDVRTARNLRHLRRTLLGADLYSGPAWDILLYLFESSVDQRRDTIGNVTTSTDLPSTTVLRWIRRLDQERLVHLCDDHLDGRRRYVELSQAAIDLMNNYFSRAAPYSIAA
jgi:DNA-binding MarR family transcriptional regulator